MSSSNRANSARSNEVNARSNRALPKTASMFMLTLYQTDRALATGYKVY